MYKTTNKWNVASYGTVYGKREQEVNRKNRLRFNNQLLVDKGRVEELKRLPKILFKNESKFSPNPTSSKKDEYIRYIINNKHRHNLNPRSFKEKVHNSSMVESSRRNRVLAKEMSIDGISFGVHYKCDSSPEDSFDHLRTNIRKDMNLMNYDFNGTSKRMANESPQSREACRGNAKNTLLRPIKIACPNKTTTKFFPVKDERLTIREQEESAASLHNTRMTEEDKNSSLSDVYESDSENSDEAEAKSKPKQCPDLFNTKSKYFYYFRTSSKREVKEICRTEEEAIE
eukprot:TRINITY_DN1720_c0_g3_i1.p1 TRINITY_DN1720_c0_g3~~TRINITY_DN1720_c0_g3_i1.p1  ORF type:complete len:286 (-),score=66.26 TRINITY_DN1720_c0_g3_i1:317-1174(-)